MSIGSSFVLVSASSRNPSSDRKQLHICVMPDEVGVQILPSVQLAMFVGSWIVSWISLFSNSYQMIFGGYGFDDVQYASTVLVLLMGLFMTNLQGYLEEQEEDPILAKAAVLDADMAVLIRRHGREICSGKPPPAWSRLKTRQALGRGIPLSMVSFYLASRHLVEAPICQLSSSLSRTLIQGSEGNSTSLVLESLANQKQICSLDLPFGNGVNCRTSEALNQSQLLADLEKADRPKSSTWKTREDAQAYEGLVWTSAHCRQSVWMLQEAAHGTTRCGHEYCVKQGAMPPGPLQKVNYFVSSQMEPLLQENENVVKAVRELIAKSSDRKMLKAAAYLIPWKLIADKVAKSARIGVDHIGGVLITSWRQWQLQFAAGLASLLLSVQPLAGVIGARRRLKPLHNRLLLLHLSLDVLILECTAVLILNANVIVHFGRGWWELSQILLDSTAKSLASAPSISELSDFSGVWGPVFKNGGEQFRKVVEGLKVGPTVFMSLAAAALIIYGSSTCLLGAISATSRFPLVARWNAAVAGPLQLLVDEHMSENRVQQLCRCVHWQILLRESLLSVLTAACLMRATSFGVGLFSSLVLRVTLFRAPFIIAWLCLLALHFSTGMLTLQEINQKQAERSQRRRLRDMEAAASPARPPAYGTFGQGAQGGNAGQSLPGVPAQARVLQPGQLGQPCS